MNRSIRFTRLNRGIVSALSVAVLLGSGCASKSVDSRGPTLTPGMVTETITVGETTKDDVKDIFGSPDIVTHRNGLTVWTFDSVTHEVEQHGAYFNILIFGTGTQRQRSSSRSTMVILYFDENEVVTEYRLNSVRR